MDNERFKLLEDVKALKWMSLLTLLFVFLTVEGYDVLPSRLHSIAFAEALLIGLVTIAFAVIVIKKYMNYSEIPREKRLAEWEKRLADKVCPACASKNVSYHKGEVWGCMTCFYGFWEQHLGTLKLVTDFCRDHDIPYVPQHYKKFPDKFTKKKKKVASKVDAIQGSLF